MGCINVLHALHDKTHYTIPAIKHMCPLFVMNHAIHRPTCSNIFQFFYVVEVWVFFLCRKFRAWEYNADVLVVLNCVDVSLQLAWFNLAHQCGAEHDYAMTADLWKGHSEHNDNHYSLFNHSLLHKIKYLGVIIPIQWNLTVTVVQLKRNYTKNYMKVKMELK